jgi:anti-sigma B factor antagonist
MEVVKLEGMVVVAPQSERLDAAEATAFKGQIVDLVNQGHTRLLLDFSRVDFMDSSGLGALLSSLKTVSASGGKMVVCGVRGNLVNLFRLTKLESIIPVFGSREEAQRALT